MPASEAAAPILIDSAAARHALGNISDRTLWDWRHREGLPFVTIKRKIFFRPSALEAWAKKRERAG
jgi:hypothetical protein